MLKLLFVDHGFHAKTQSNIFFRDLLAQRFQLEVLWDESWVGRQPLAPAVLNEKKADALLFFQLLPTPRALRRLRYENVTWVPMRDGLSYRSSRLRRIGASGIKVLNFCHEAHVILEHHGIQSHYCQYWPAPAQFARPARVKPHLFFWQRVNEIGWPILKALLGRFRPERIVFRPAADPGHWSELPSVDDLREYNVTVLEGWLDQADYLTQLSDCDLFMAPRPLEGIGIATLEAMRHGLSVIAPTAPTMNEYVVDGRSGWLYELTQPEPLDFSDWHARGFEALAAVERGHATWLAQRAGVSAFVAAPPAVRPRWHWRLRSSLRI